MKRPTKATATHTTTLSAAPGRWSLAAPPVKVAGETGETGVVPDMPSQPLLLAGAVWAGETGVTERVFLPDGAACTTLTGAGAGAGAKG